MPTSQPKATLSAEPRDEGVGGINIGMFANGQSISMNDTTGESTVYPQRPARFAARGYPRWNATSSPGLRKWLADTYYSIDAGTSTEELCKELAQTKSRTAENQNSASSHDGVNAERTGMLSRFEQWATQATRKMVALVHSPSDKSSDRQPNTVQTSPTQLRNSSAMQGFHPHACPDTWMNIQLQRCSVNGWFGIKIECVKSGFSIVHVTDAVANRSSAPVNVGDYIEKINGIELARGMDITAILRGCGPVANLRIRRSHSSAASTASPPSSCPQHHANEPVAGQTCCRATPRLVELLVVLDQCARQKHEQELQRKKHRMPHPEDVVRWKQHRESSMHRYDGPTTDLVTMTTGLSMSTGGSVRSSREQWMESLTAPWSTSFT